MTTNLTQQSSVIKNLNLKSRNGKKTGIAFCMRVTFPSISQRRGGHLQWTHEKRCSETAQISICSALPGVYLTWVMAAIWGAQHATSSYRWYGRQLIRIIEIAAEEDASGQHDHNHVQHSSSSERYHVFSFRFQHIYNFICSQKACVGQM